jgi:hypothetical protein
MANRAKRTMRQDRIEAARPDPEERDEADEDIETEEDELTGDEDSLTEEEDFEDDTDGSPIR